MTDHAASLEFVTRPERHIAATAREYTMDTRHEIPGHWQAFFQAGYQFENAVDGAMFGVSFMADGQGAFRYGVGVEVDPVPATQPDGTCIITLGAGDYAVLRRFGSVGDLPATMDRMFSEYLPASGRSMREGAVFECYPDDPRNGPDGMAYEIWAPVD